MTHPTSRPRVLVIGTDADSDFRRYRNTHLHAIARRYKMEIVCWAESPDAPASPYPSLPDVPVHEIPAKKRGVRLADLGTLVTYISIIRRTRPDVVHLIGDKPVVYGGLALRILPRPAVIATLGGLPIRNKGEFPGVMGILHPLMTRIGYRLALRRSRIRVITENSDDPGTLEHLGCIHPGVARVIRGTGIDLEAYTPAPKAHGEAFPVVIMAPARRRKGVMEFAEAARLLLQKGIKARFVVVGKMDPNSVDSLTAEEIQRLKEGGHVELWGLRTDMAQILPGATIACLPSYHREGMPRFLMESAACGLPAVTTDMPGCREAVADGETGLLVPPRDAHALAGALGALLGDPERAAAMGRAARARAEALFGYERIVAETLAVYQELLEPDSFPDANTS